MGQLKSSLTCSECGYCSTAFDPFWDLSLPIPKVRGPHRPQSPAPHTLCLTHAVLPQKGYGEVTLMDCLRLFTKEDVLDGDEKPVRGMGAGGLALVQAGPLSLPCLCCQDCGLGAQWGWPLLSPSCLCCLSPTDMLSLQSQDKVHKEIQHPEVPQDPGASYPSGGGTGPGGAGGGAGGSSWAPLCPSAP